MINLIKKKGATNAMGKYEDIIQSKIGRLGQDICPWDVGVESLKKKMRKLNVSAPTNRSG